MDLSCTRRGCGRCSGEGATMLLRYCPHAHARTYASYGYALEGTRICSGHRESSGRCEVNAFPQDTVAVPQFLVKVRPESAHTLCISQRFARSRWTFVFKAAIDHHVCRIQEAFTSIKGLGGVAGVGGSEGVLGRSECRREHGGDGQDCPAKDLFAVHVRGVSRTGLVFESSR